MTGQRRPLFAFLALVLAYDVSLAVVSDGVNRWVGGIGAAVIVACIVVLAIDTKRHAS